MLQDQIMLSAMERAGAMNWLTASNAIMAAAKGATSQLETTMGDGDDTEVLPVAEMMEEINKTVSYACNRCHHMNTCPRRCPVNLFLVDLENLLKAD